MAELSEMVANKISSKIGDSLKNSNEAFVWKLRKLKTAKTLALSKSAKKKKLAQAEELSDKIDAKIQSVALNKFAVAKKTRLKDLGQTREDTHALIKKLMASVENKNILQKGGKSLKGFGIDKNFVGMSAAEVLEKVKGIKKSEEQPETEPKKGKGSKGEKPKGSKGSKGEKPKGSKLIQGNPDTDTIEDINQNNERIYDHFVKIGDLDTANYLLDLMTAPTSKGTPKVSDVSANTDELKKLSVINSGIYKKLDEIEENMVDEQDTAISIPERLQQEKEKEEKAQLKPKEEPEKGGGFFGSILKMILGTSIFDLLTGGGGAKGLALRILKSGGFWIVKKIKSMFTSLFKLAIKPFQMMLSKIQNVVSGIKGVGKAAFSKVKKFAGLAKDKAVSTGKKITEGATKFSKNASELSKNLSQKISQAFKKKGTEKTAKKISQAGIKKGTKTALTKTIAKGLGKVLGAGLAVGFSAYEAKDGWDNADKILGKDKKDLTEVDKTDAAAGSVINGLTFGAISKWDGAKWFRRFGVGMGDASKHIKVIGAAEHSGIVKDNTVLDWEKFKKLPVFDMNALLHFKDFNSEDRKKIREIIKFKKSPQKTETTQKTQKTETTETTETTQKNITKVFNAPEKVPNKVDVSTQKSKIQAKVDLMNSNIDELRALQRHHINNNQQDKADQLDEYINDEVKAMYKLKSTMNTITPNVSKDKKMKEAEEAYVKSIKNTQDFANVTLAGGNNQSINNINVPVQQHQNFSSFELFDTKRQ